MKEINPMKVDRHKTQLFVPFQGRWLVFWGGDTKKLNQHHGVHSQRFAFDFLAVNEASQPYSGRGTKNEDWYSFGREILAPADGLVTDVIDGVRDNRPGSMNPYIATGNAVFIKHRRHEISVLAHFKLGSLRVTVGDRVKRGNLIGLCGNSGNSSAPHLHYHLQNMSLIQEGTGIKPYFHKIVVMRDGKSSSRTDYSPIKGEIISPK